MSNTTAEPLMAQPQPDSFSSLLFSREFACIMGAAFLAYANVSVFFGYVDHLHTLPIATTDYGMLIGALAAVALVLRPVISPFFHSGNARPLLFLGTGLMAFTLAAYSLAGAFWSMLLVRLLHGISFAILGTALMTLIVAAVPREKSAQFFGYIAVVTLLPNTLVPPLLPLLESWLGNFNRMLLLFAALTLLMFPLILALGRKAPEKKDGALPAGLSGREILENLKDIRVIRILLAMLLLYCGHALVFFFLDGYGRSIGLVYAGIFLTFSTVGEIGVRVVAGGLFDRMDKAKLAGWSLVGLGMAYAVLALAPGKWGFFAIGLCFGLGWGVAMPVFNGLMFDVSKPRFRAFNINLGLQMFQGGFFLGPLIGAPILAGWGYAVLYYLCALMSLLAAVLMFCQRSAKK